MHHWSCRPGAIGEIADLSRAKNVLIFLRGRSINANDVENLYIYICICMCGPYAHQHAGYTADDSLNPTLK